MPELLHFQFNDTANAGIPSLTVGYYLYQIARSNGAYTALITNGSTVVFTNMTGSGFANYTGSFALATYDYRALFVSSDGQMASSLWSQFGKQGDLLGFNGTFNASSFVVGAGTLTLNGPAAFNGGMTFSNFTVAGATLFSGNMTGNLFGSVSNVTGTVNTGTNVVTLPALPAVTLAANQHVIVDCSISRFLRISMVRFSSASFAAMRGSAWPIRFC